jgi:tetratricopeptide (TPR) repeat protein
MRRRVLVCMALLVSAAIAQSDPDCLAARAEATAGLNAGRLEDARAVLTSSLHNSACPGSALAALAVVERRLGNFQNAEHYAIRAASLLGRGEGDEAPLAGALRILALTYVDRGLPRKALPIFERLGAMTIAEVSDRAALRGSLAAALQASGDASGAEREYLAAIALWESCCEATRFVAELSNLGMLYFDSGRLGEAAATLLRALSALSVSTPGNDDQKIDILNNLAVLRTEQNQSREAQAYAQQAVNLLEKSGPEKHLRAAEVYRNCAAVFRSAHRKREAKALEARARERQSPPRAIVDVSEWSGFAGRRK